MPSLRELQANFMRALLDGDIGRASTSVRESELSSALRIGIYANNTRANFIDALISSYPVVRRLVGEDYFIQVARTYHSQSPSRSGDLHPAGGEFARHLAELHANDEFRYLSDVARFEWLLQETLLALESGPLDAATLQRISPSQYDSICFHLHPSARLFASEFPCRRIWQANIDGTREPEMIDLTDGSDRILMTRTQGQLQFHDLSCPETRFLQALQGQESLAAAIAVSGDDLDAAAALRRFYLAGIIADVSSPP